MSQPFVVSALKYRPQTFDTVVGQSHITSTLKNAIKTDHLAHSFLFCGPRGVGKTTCARILAKTINCTNRTGDNEACDECENCTSFKNNTSFNVHELDAASNNSVEDIRSLIEQTRFAPQAGSKYKVYIIDEVHMLSTNAFNAFLKTLEEPPSYAIFILATTEKHKILPTILSRCQIFDFKRITSKDTVEHLQDICQKEHIPAEEDALHFIALKSEGCMRDALSIMDKISSFSGGNITYQSTIDNLNILDYDYFFKITDSIMLQNLPNVMLMYDDILSKGFEGDMFVNGLCEHFRNLMICKEPATAKLMDVAEGIKKKYFTQAVQVSQSLIINTLSILNQCEINYKQTRNKRLHVELALIKLCHLQNAVEILNDAEGNVLKKKLSNNFVSLVVKKYKPQEASLQIANNLMQAKENKKIATVLPSAIVNEETTPIASTNSGFKLSELNKLKERAKQTLQEKNTKPVLEITLENAIVYWQNYIQTNAKDKTFIYQTLLQSKVSLQQKELSIDINESMAYEFILNKKLEISQYFKDSYNDQELLLYIIYTPKPIDKSQIVKSTKDRYEDIIIKYPLIKELKDKLSLDFEL